MKYLLFQCAFWLIIGFNLLFSCKPKESNPSPAIPTQLDASTGKGLAGTSNVATSAAISEINSNSGIVAFRSLTYTGAISTGTGVFPTGSLRTSENESVLDILAVTKWVISKGANNSNGRIAPDFNASKGIWEFNFTTKEIVKTAVADKIIIKFPDSTNLANNTGVNNCTYTIYQLNTIFYTNTSQWGRIDTLVTKLNADMYVSNNKAFDFDYSLSYVKDQIIKGDYTYHIGDYEVILNYESKNLLVPFSFINYSLSKSSTVIYSYTVSPTYIGDSLSILDYSVIVGDVKLVSKFEYGKYLNNYLKTAYSPIIQYATDTLMASSYDTGLLTQISTGAKIGDLKYLRSKINGAPCNTCYSYYLRSKRVISYNDGTYQDLETVFSSLKTSILQYLLFGPIN